MRRQASSYVVRMIWPTGTALLDGTTVGNMEQRAAYPYCFWEGAAPSTSFGMGEGEKGGEGGEGKFHAYHDDGDVDRLYGAAPAPSDTGAKILP